MTLEGIAENVIADIIFLVVAIVLGWTLFLFTRRRQLLKFFGIDTSRRIVIYLSNLRVKPFGTIGMDGQERSYEGSTVAFYEMLVANRFRDLFNYPLPSLSEKPGVLSKLLISDVQVELLSSPLNHGQLETSSSFITLGGPAYNSASDFVETELHARAQFRFGHVTPTTETEASAAESVKQSSQTFTTVVSSSSSSSSSVSTSASGSVPSSPTCLPMNGLDSRTEPAETRPAILVEGIPPITDTAFGFVERIADHEQKRCVFYTAGLSELGTVGAAHFLATEWARLYRKYGSNTSFLVMLRFDRTDFRRWFTVFERAAP
jgi:hypothetical protein